MWKKKEVKWYISFPNNKNSNTDNSSINTTGDSLMYTIEKLFHQ